jgi:thioester reductase-like protein
MQPEVVSFDKPLAADRILLTGATGVLGAHLMKELLRTTNATVYCLVRAANPSEGKERLRGFLRLYDPDDTLAKQFDARIVAVIGDIVGKTLELPADQYIELARTIDVTIHSAAMTNLFSRYSQIEPVNVGGTKNIIRFALQTKQKYLVYVSTYTVMGDKFFDPTLVFKESDFDMGQGFRWLTYQESKFNGERLVREAAKDGLVWNVVRPGQIFGEADSGLYPQGLTSVGGLFYDVFKTITDTGVGPRCRWHCDISPVDFVSQGLLHLALVRNSYYEVYHLTNPDVKTYEDIIGMVGRLGYDIRFMEQSDYAQVLVSRELALNGQEYKSSATQAMRWWSLRQLFDYNRSATTDCTYTAAILREAGIVCPPIDYKLLCTYFNESIRQGYFVPPKGRDMVREPEEAGTR